MPTQPRKKEPAARGRPRQFDLKAAMARIAEVFWQNGYSGTSLDDLAAATGLARPSLYAAYGDKRAMYLQALAHFGNTMREALGPALAGNDLARDLSKAFSAAIEIYTSGTSTARGCLAVCTAATESANDAVIRDALSAVFSAMDAAFTDRIRRAQQNEKEAPPGDPALLGGITAATLHSIALRARVGVPRRELRKLAENSIQLICGRPG